MSPVTGSRCANNCFGRRTPTNGITSSSNPSSPTRTTDGAQGFFSESAGRWSKCANHNVNIQLNGQPLPAWRSGVLTKTNTRLAMPYIRGSGDQTRSCQHVLSLAANLILDIQACKPQQQPSVTQAGAIADKIESKLPR